jgi:hypothetical protein
LSGDIGFLRPGELIGLPDGVPDVVHHLASFRYGLLAVALLWAWAACRGARALTVAAGAVFASGVLVFWTLALGRPYGLLVDAAATRRAALISIAGTTGHAASFLAGEDGARHIWPALAGVSLLLPTLLPVAVTLLLPLSIYALWPARDAALLAAALWSAFSTGDLEAARGVGFLSGLWAHPEGSLLVLLIVTVTLGTGRVLGDSRAVWVLPLPWLCWAGAATLMSGQPAAPMPAMTRLLLLTLDQFPWLPLAVVGLRLARSWCAIALALAGTAAVLAGFDPWVGQAVYRLGLLLAGAPAVARAADVVGALAQRHLARVARGTSRDIGLALLLLATVPGSFAAWWEPGRMDVVADASLERVSPALLSAMRQIRRAAPPGSVFVAGPEFSPALAVLAGRRVLRAPTLVTAADEERRLRAERQVLAGEPGAAVVAHYGITHVFVAPGDFRAYGIRAPEDLGARGGLRLVLENQEGWRLYELPGAPGPTGAFR